MNIMIKEAVGYTAVSACALLVDIAILWILVNFFSWWYLAAATVSFLTGLGLTYSICVTHVFKHRRLKDPRIEFLSFAVIGAVGLGINTAVIGFAVKYLGLHYLLAKCAAAGCSFVWNFISRRQLLFVKPRSA